MKLLKFTVEKFFPYESVFLQDRFLEIENEEEIAELLTQIWKSVKSWKPIGFSENYCYPSLDNKITFEVNSSDKIFYIQYYDTKIIFGFEVMKRNYDPLTHYYRPHTEFEIETEDLLKKINYNSSGFTSNERITTVTPMHTTSLPMLKINWKEKYVLLENINKSLKVNLDVETIKEKLKNFIDEEDYPEDSHFIRDYFAN